MSAEEFPSGPGRRDFLKMAAAAPGAAVARTAGSAPASSPASTPDPGELIDTNVTLSRWPLRRLPYDETPALVTKLRSQGVTQAWAGSFDALLHRDLAAVNARLVDDCRHHGDGRLVPFGSINPMLPEWEDDLRRCAEEHCMPGIRLYPGYHGYRLDDPVFAQLLRAASQRGLLVQLVVTLEDRRMMHPLLQVDPPSLQPLAGILDKTPDLRLELLGWKSAPPLNLIQTGRVSLEISMTEGVSGVATLLSQAPAGSVLFGSHAPLFCWESALLKLQESALNPEQLRALRCANAQRWLARNLT